MRLCAHRIAIRPPETLRTTLSRGSMREREERLVREQADLLNLVNPVMEQVITLNVSGKIFYTTLHTLTKQRGSLLAALFGSSRPLRRLEDGSVFLDRNAEAFGYVLEWLRSGVIPNDLNSRETLLVQAEARFWQLGDLVSCTSTTTPVAPHPHTLSSPCASASLSTSGALTPRAHSRLSSSGNIGDILLAYPRPFTLPPELSVLSNFLLGKWVEIYRASRHGFASKEFHALCGGRGETLVLYQDKNGWLFGGYSSYGWPSQNEHSTVTDDRAFLFTLTNPHSIPPTVFPVKNTSAAISTDPIFGPTFGNGDIYAPHNANMNQGSFDFPHDYSDSTQLGKLLFTGTPLWYAKEIIVFVRPTAV